MKKSFWFWAIAIVAIVLIIVFIGRGNNSVEAGKYDEFAQCLTTSGAKFYGAYWCPHCNEQKKDFGDSVRYINYIECSTPDGNGQTEICQVNFITGYPTWEFGDGTRMSGRVALETLSQKSGCILPA